MYMRSNPCNMKAVIAVKKTTKANVKMDFWYDNFPSLYHFDVADDFSNRYNYVRDQIIGHGNHLMTNTHMKSTNNSKQKSTVHPYHHITNQEPIQHFILVIM